MEEYRFNLRPDEDDEEEKNRLERIKRDEKAEAKKKKDKEAEEQKRKLKKDKEASDYTDRVDATNTPKKRSKEDFLLRTLIYKEDRSAAKNKKTETDNTVESDDESEKEPIEKLSAKERIQALQEYIKRRQVELQHDEEGDDNGLSERIQRQAQKTFLQRFSQMIGLKAVSHESPQTEDDMLEHASTETIAFMRQHAAENTELPLRNDDGFESEEEGLNDEPTDESHDGSGDAPDAENTDLETESVVTGTNTGTVPGGTINLADNQDIRTLDFESGGAFLNSENASFSSEPSDISPRESTLQSGVSKNSFGTTEFLLGGFVGYLFGKRRGRIKSESEQAPVRKKLESEVKALEAKVRTYEQKVRLEARSIVERPAPTTPASHTRTAEKTIISPIKNENVSPAFQEVNQLHTSDLIREASHDIGIPVSAPRTLEQPTSRAEVSKSSSSMNNRIEKDQYDSTPSKVSIEAGSMQSSKAPVELMHLSAVLAEAERVSFEGNSVRAVFERGDIDESTLREAIKMKRAGGEEYKEIIKRRVRSFEALEQKNMKSDLGKENNKHEGESQSKNAASSGPESSNESGRKLKQLSPRKRSKVFMQPGGKGVSPQSQFLIGIIFGIFLVGLALAVFM